MRRCQKHLRIFQCKNRLPKKDGAVCGQDGSVHDNPLWKEAFP